jgi:hypothetical protein
MEELHTDRIDGGHEASYGARSRARERAYSNTKLALSAALETRNASAGIDWDAERTCETVYQTSLLRLSQDVAERSASFTSRHLLSASGWQIQTPTREVLSFYRTVEVSRTVQLSSQRGHCASRLDDFSHPIATFSSFLPPPYLRICLTYTLIHNVPSVLSPPRHLFLLNPRRRLHPMLHPPRHAPRR